MKTIIIAEAGVNHNGCLETAIEMVNQASYSKADFINWTNEPKSTALINTFLFLISKIKVKLWSNKLQLFKMWFCFKAIINF